jgi:hypothetical protein
MQLSIGNGRPGVCKGTFVIICNLIGSFGKMAIETALSYIEFTVGVPVEKVLIFCFENIIGRFRPLDLVGGMFPKLKVGIKGFLEGFLITGESPFDDSSHDEEGMADPGRRS